MSRQILIFEIAVGYMLKVIKSGKHITLYKKEFSSIRHGDYFTFINIVGEKIPFIVTYHNGQVYIDNNNNENDFDFLGLLKSSNSLKVFYEKCINHYGEIVDNDIQDKTYCQLAYFEICLRMHANNYRLLKKGEKLKDVIDKVCVHFRLTIEEKLVLHDGRRFLNMVKHNKKQFQTWSIGKEAILRSLNVIERHQLTIYKTL